MAVASKFWAKLLQWLITAVDFDIELENDILRIVLRLGSITIIDREWPMKLEKSQTAPSGFRFTPDSSQVNPKKGRGK